MDVNTSTMMKSEPVPPKGQAVVVSRLSSPATPAARRGATTRAAAVAATPMSGPDDTSPILAPTESSQASHNKANEKQVRFGGGHTNSQHGSSSGGGGTSATFGQTQMHRYVSPGRSTTGTATTNNNSNEKNSHGTEVPAVLEYKTYRSPERAEGAKRGTSAGEETEVPSLCSTYSCVSSGGSNEFKAAPACSISVDHSTETTTSPLSQMAHDEKGETLKGSMAAQTTNPNETFSACLGSAGTESLDSLAKASAAVSAKTSSQPRYLSPKSTKLSFLRDLADEKKGGEDDFADGELELHAKMDDRILQSPHTRDHVSTPTDFAVDYCKSSNTVFDSSNVLAWLQSPTVHGLFSPGGGLGSLMNTPAGGGAPRTPRTPTISTSFFFADVESLPNTDGTPCKSDGAKKSQKGSTICISPLASTRPRPMGVPSAGTPMDFKDIFASPRERRQLPLLADTPNKADRRGDGKARSKSDPNFDAVHLAERDLLEDDDLNVLLQLASNTPASKHGGGVFRSPAPKEGENFPGLELPMIGNDADGEGRKTNKTKLQQKAGGRNELDGENFGPPQLGMRSSSSIGSTNAKDSIGKSTGSDKTGKEKGMDVMTSLKSTGSGSLANPYSMTNAYPVPPDMQAYYPLSGMGPVPPNSSGSMRVVMGGPPPRRNNNNGTGKQGSSPVGPGSSSSGPPPYHEYPPPPGNMQYPPPPPGMFSSFPSYNGMGSRYTPYSHYPPPPHQMPMYNAQTSSGKANTPSTSPTKETKKGKNTKAGAGSKATSGNKRSAASSATDSKAQLPSDLPGAPSATASPPKKQRKSPSKKKNKSPPLVGAERERSAATIQAVNKASGAHNDKAAALAAAILRGVTMRPSGKWQAQLYFAGKSRYIGVFDTREKAALAYEIAREKLKAGPTDATISVKSTENLVNAARKAAFDGVNESLPK